MPVSNLRYLLGPGMEFVFDMLPTRKDIILRHLHSIPSGDITSWCVLVCNTGMIVSKILCWSRYSSTARRAPFKWKSSMMMYLTQAHSIQTLLQFNLPSVLKMRVQILQKLHCSLISISIQSQKSQLWGLKRW